MKIVIFVGLTVMLVTGCVTLAPKSIGRDTYMVESMGTTFTGSALSAASSFCIKQGKNLQLITTNKAGIGPGASASVTFMCLDLNDPRYTTSVMRQDNGVTTIENR